MPNNRIFLVQGVFWQPYQWLGVRMEPIEGAVAVINSGIVNFVYSGVVGEDETSALGEKSGEMNDRFGRSSISRFIMAADRLSWKKQYDNKDYAIDYVFPTKEGVVWQGYYVGPENVGRGITCCIVTEVPTSLLNPSHILEKLTPLSPQLRGALTAPRLGHK